MGKLIRVLCAVCIVVAGCSDKTHLYGGGNSPQGGTITSVIPGLCAAGGGTSGAVTVSKNAAVIAPVALTGTQQNNYAPVDATSGFGLTTVGCGVVSQDASADTTISGFSSASITAGFEFEFHNISTHNITFTYLDGGSSGANQISLPQGLAWKITTGGSALFHYTGSVWRVVYVISTDYPTLTLAGASLGVNAYANTTTYSWKSEHISAVLITNTLDQIWQGSFSGAGTTFSSVGGTGRTGVMSGTTGSTAGGRATFLTSATMPTSIYTSMTHDHTFGVPTLDNGADQFVIETGFLSSGTTLAQTNGCWAEYDHNGLMSAPTTGTKPSGDLLGCWCSSASSTTAYPMDGSTHDDSGNATVSVPIAARTWPSTHILHVQVIYTSAETDFWVDQGSGLVKSCVIKTHIPAASIADGWFILKNAGTNPVTIEADFTGLTLVQSAVRASP